MKRNKKDTICSNKVKYTRTHGTHRSTQSSSSYAVRDAELNPNVSRFLMSGHHHQPKWYMDMVVNDFDHINYSKIVIYKPGHIKFSFHCLVLQRPRAHDSH